MGPLDPPRSATSATQLLTTSLPTESVTAVHMHEGAEGENGPVVFELPEVHWSRWDSVVVNASMDYEGNVSIDDLFDLMRSGRAYVDIHTVSHPGGALRGQLEVTRFEERSGYHCG